MLRNVKLILPIISSILLILAFPRFNLGFLAWIALIPLFFALENKNIKQRFAIGYLFGLIFFSGILYWLVNVTVPGTIVLVLLLSLAPAIFCSLYLKLITYNLLLFLAIPSAWVITEYLRTYLFTGFPWALLGYSQYLNLPVIQISDITGSYGISFIIVLVNFCIYAIIKKFPNKKIFTTLGISILIVTVFYGFYRLNQKYMIPPIKVAVVQGNIPQSMKWDRTYEKFILDKYEFITLEAQESNPDIIIWPETSVPGILGRDKHIFSRVTNLARSIDTDLLIGTIREIDSKFYNSATLVSKEGRILESYDKLHLVPFGEYVPLEKYMPWFRNTIDKPIGNFEPGTEFKLLKVKTGQASVIGDSIIKDTRFYKFGTLICFEDIFPNLARRFVKEGALFLVNITNDAWFGKTSAPYQHVQSSVFRAVENRVPVIRSANTGVSCFIDQKGRIIDSVRINGEEIFVDGYTERDIYPLSIPTIYTRFGDIFCYVCLALYLTSLIKRRYVY